jgi:hypothetical protein
LLALVQRQALSACRVNEYKLLDADHKVLGLIKLSLRGAATTRFVIHRVTIFESTSTLIAKSSSFASRRCSRLKVNNLKYKKFLFRFFFVTINEISGRESGFSKYFYRK